mgnify:CR=1 FL=1
MAYHSGTAGVLGWCCGTPACSLLKVFNISNVAKGIADSEIFL